MNSLKMSYCYLAFRTNVLLNLCCPGHLSCYSPNESEPLNECLRMSTSEQRYSGLTESHLPSHWDSKEHWTPSTSSQLTSYARRQTVTPKSLTLVCGLQNLTEVLSRRWHPDRRGCEEWENSGMVWQRCGTLGRHCVRSVVMALTTVCWLSEARCLPLSESEESEMLT